MGLSSFLGGGLLKGVGGIMNAGKGIYTAIAGDKGAEQQALHAEQMSVHSAYQMEWAAQMGKTGLINSLVNAANRLVRPLYTYGVIALFVWCAVDPVEFTMFVQALSVMPELMWYVLLTITAFWFGGRLLEKAPKSIKGVNKEALAAVMASRKQMKAEIKEEEGLITDKEYQEQMKSSKPLSNAAIMEWNARRKNK